MGETRREDAWVAPTLLRPGDPSLADALALIKAEFAYMDGVIDPPSSMHGLTVETLATDANEVWVIRRPPLAVMVLTPKPPVLYVGRLAVASDARGNGYARMLIEQAEHRAGMLGLEALELQVRVELTGNQAAFKAMGFEEVGRTSHPGYERATSVTMRRGMKGKKIRNEIWVEHRSNE